MVVAHNSRWGAKLGPRIAILVSQAITYTHHKLHHMKHRLAMAVFHSISDEISDEVDITLGPLLRMLHENTPEDHMAYPAVKFMHEATGQLKAIAGTGLQMTGLLGAFSSIVNNELADIVYNVIRANPALLPDPSTIVQAYATASVDQKEALAGLAAQGIQYGWGERMLRMGFSYPALGESLELLRRGKVNRDQVIQWMLLNGVPGLVAETLTELSSIPVSPADAALAVLRGNINQAAGEAIAAENGLDQAGFNILIGNTGEPPGLESLMEAYRRGFIDEATLKKGILESRYRNEWIPMLERLRYSPMSVSDAVRATVQNQMSADEARKIADANGLEPGHFDILVATEGNPLSRTEMADLYNRGLATQGQFEQAIRESRYKNKYVPLAFDLVQAIPPVETVTRALRYGSISHGDAARIIAMHGYSAQDATVIIAAGSGERTQGFKDRMVTAAAGLYEQGIISQADLSTTVTSLGFTGDEATFIVKSADFHREARMIGGTVTAIKGKYLNRHITKQSASGLLDQAGIPAGQRDALLKEWDVERTAFVRLLTPAQVLKAVKLELITADVAETRLIDMGYSTMDAQLLLAGA